MTATWRSACATYLLHLDADGNSVRNPTYYYAPINGDAVHQQSGEQANMRYLTLSDRPEEDVSQCLTARVHASHPPPQE